MTYIDVPRIVTAVAGSAPYDNLLVISTVTTSIITYVVCTPPLSIYIHSAWPISSIIDTYQNVPCVKIYRVWCLDHVDVIIIPGGLSKVHIPSFI